MPLNRNHFIDVFKFLSYPLIACNAFSMCSDVLPSLAYFGISGSVVYVLLAAVFLVWLLLYLSKGSNQSKMKTELEYYEYKLMTSRPKENYISNEDLFFARYLVLFNEFRFKIYSYIIKNGYSKNDQLEKILTATVSKLEYKYSISGELASKVKEMLANFLKRFNDLVDGQDDKEKALLDALKFNDKNIFGGYSLPDGENNKVIKVFKQRNAYFLGHNTIFLIFLYLATANIIVNALTMYGSSSGVIRALASIFGTKIYMLNQGVLSVVFFLGGGIASLNLTYPMIQNFGRKLELVFQDFNYSIKNFSWHTVLAAVMAFFTAVGSAIFALYNSPVSGMMPPFFAGYAKLLTAVIAFFSVFSLYFVSVSSKFEDCFSRKNNYKISVSDIILASLILFASFLVDITFMPSSCYGILEASTLVGVGTKFWGKHGLLICIALLAAFSFSVTSFHQFSILFHPSSASKAFIIFEVIFQFSTFTVTFYYGLNKFFSMNNASLDMKTLTEIPESLKSVELGIPRDGSNSTLSSSPTCVNQIDEDIENWPNKRP